MLLLLLLLQIATKPAILKVAVVVAKCLALPPTTAFQWLAKIRFETTATLYEHNRLMAQHHPIPIHFENVNLAPRT